MAQSDGERVNWSSRWVQVSTRASRGRAGGIWARRAGAMQRCSGGSGRGTNLLGCVVDGWASDRGGAGAARGAAAPASADPVSSERCPRGGRENKGKRKGRGSVHAVEALYAARELHMRCLRGPGDDVPLGPVRLTRSWGGAGAWALV
ncbi:hypothetical protein EJ04DRAFT_94865 [Polyplosphaeria fusca]|uniref:Uncharacterized protein n=1 Tax=Polyplosphaeria fusca TaxID=682080 RepID=A0A9P4V5P7_9PLEO|nr:hypothetical protein EJ04DRAFT_94865 [Polyplosphaeria fusca]